MKLYFNSFNNTKFDNIDKLTQAITHDLSNAVGSKATFTLIPLTSQIPQENLASSSDNQIINQINIHHNFNGICLDELDIECDTYLPNPSYLQLQNQALNNKEASNTPETHEMLYSNLLKSNCLVTHQPDWGSVYIEYAGMPIDHPGLLKYIVSLRNHNEFHEQCVERIFNDILINCKPQQLTVYARYTRRGGLDINPYRTTDANYNVTNLRLVRQ